MKTERQSNMNIKEIEAQCIKNTVEKHVKDDSLKNEILNVLTKVCRIKYVIEDPYTNAVLVSPNIDDPVFVGTAKRNAEDKQNPLQGKMIALNRMIVNYLKKRIPDTGWKYTVSDTISVNNPKSTTTTNCTSSTIWTTTEVNVDGMGNGPIHIYEDKTVARCTCGKCNK